MNIVCDKNMPYAAEAFGTLGTVHIVDGRGITADHVRNADVLAVRSTTRVNAALLNGSAVRFVGTATIGTDHMDIPWLERQGIHWCFAPGCNANSVSEYFTTALLCLSQRHGFTLDGKTVGVIGVGNVGSRVVAKAQALGMRVLPNDPPRERAEGPRANGLPPFASLDQILAESDIITLHVPLNTEGRDATRHLAKARFFEAMKPGALFINAARGPVMDTPALQAALKSGRVAHAVLDTWEGEPDFSETLLASVDIGTPHIAGHSFEGKVMGTVMVYRDACRFLGTKAVWSPESLLPPPLVPHLDVDARGRSDEAVLWDIVRPVYDIEADDRALRASHPAETTAAHFDRLRKHYPVRREFRFTRVTLRHASEALTAKVRQLGFTIA